MLILVKRRERLLKQREELKTKIKETPDDPKHHAELTQALYSYDRINVMIKDLENKLEGIKKL